MKWLMKETKDCLATIRELCKLAGLDPVSYGTHSCRIGGATCALDTPHVSQLVVKAAGYWKAIRSTELYTKPTLAQMKQVQRHMTTCTRTTAMLN